MNAIKRLAKRIVSKVFVSHKRWVIRTLDISPRDVLVPLQPSHTEMPNDMAENGRLSLLNLVNSSALVGVELGVAEGYFSDTLLRCSRLKRLYSIDAWSDHHDSDEYMRACMRLSVHGTRSNILRSYFDDAVSLFSDNSLDFVYFDAYAHTGQQDGRLFEQWYPKIKNGGLCCGHDYDIVHWPQTVNAVDKFAASLGKDIRVIPGVFSSNPQDLHPSWYFYK